jgi:hypothetical protein
MQERGQAQEKLDGRPTVFSSATGAHYSQEANGSLKRRHVIELVDGTIWDIGWDYTSKVERRRRGMGHLSRREAEDVIRQKLEEHRIFTQMQADEAKREAALAATRPVKGLPACAEAVTG